MNDRQKALREFHSTHFSHLRITESQWSQIDGQPPPRLRPGTSQLEMEVRYHNGDVAWEPLNMPMGRTDSPDASAMGGQHSRKKH